MDEFHIHELLDRTHCMNVMFEELISNHPAADILRKRVDEVGEKLADLYQAIGALTIT